MKWFHKADVFTVVFDFFLQKLNMPLRTIFQGLPKKYSSPMLPTLCPCLMLVNSKPYTDTVDLISH